MEQYDDEDDDMMMSSSMKSMEQYSDMMNKKLNTIIEKFKMKKQHLKRREKARRIRFFKSLAKEFPYKLVISLSKQALKAKNVNIATRNHKLRKFLDKRHIHRLDRRLSAELKMREKMRQKIKMRKQRRMIQRRMKRYNMMLQRKQKLFDSKKQEREALGELPPEVPSVVERLVWSNNKSRNRVGVDFIRGDLPIVGTDHIERRYFSPSAAYTPSTSLQDSGIAVLAGISANSTQQELHSLKQFISSGYGAEGGISYKTLPQSYAGRLKQQSDKPVQIKAFA